MFNLFKGKYPFKKGDLVSNGKERLIVNAVFEDNEGKVKLLVDDDLWLTSERKAHWCREVFASDFYKVC